MIPKFLLNGKALIITLLLLVYVSSGSKIKAKSPVKRS
jgi:hypothetical protein